jgi:cytochrome c oxidase cbb3-type subunit I/II
MMTFGMLYWLMPRLYKTQLFSTKLANWHFWLATTGMLFFAIPLYFAGFTQSLMWKEFTAEGYLKYPNFIETVTQVIPMYWLRVLGGTLYITGVIMMIYNLIMTAKAGTFVPTEEDEAPALEAQPVHTDRGHRIIEGKPLLFTLLALVAILIGGIVEFLPMFMIKSNVPTISSVQPYTPLELEGRDIYLRDGCYTCHSQMVRPFRSEVERYGDYSKAGESVYDHPFQFGSKRTGPDLAREGVKGGPMYKPNSWHYNHFMSPQKMVAESIMPPFPWLINNDLDYSSIAKKISVMQTLGVPYPDGFENQAKDHLLKQANEIAQGLRNEGIEVADTKEVIALIAYIQRLGTDIHKTDNTSAFTNK